MPVDDNAFLPLGTKNLFSFEIDGKPAKPQVEDLGAAVVVEEIHRQSGYSPVSARAHQK